MLQRFKDGQSYMKMWPLRAELNPIFPENRVIKATQFALKMMPAFAVLVVFLQWTLSGHQHLPQSILTALFALSLPLQGFWWLGVRANTPLPPDTLLWYQNLQKRLSASISHAPPKLHPSSNIMPCYKELAILLKQAFIEADKNGFDLDL